MIDLTKYALQPNIHEVCMASILICCMKLVTHYRCGDNVNCRPLSVTTMSFG
jgi:hypothetical protein